MDSKARERETKNIQPQPQTQAQAKAQASAKRDIFEDFVPSDRRRTKVDTLYIGIDLGTSRSAIATNTGVRTSVSSIVGWPKDTVAKKLLERDVVFGSEALEKRLSLDIIRPLENGVIKFSDASAEELTDDAYKYEQAARELIQHIIEQADPQDNQQIFGVIGAPAQASIHNKKAIIKAARELLDAVLIVSEPFAMAYGLNRLNDVLVVDIGAGTTDLCRMHGAIPTEEDQLTIHTAGDYIDEALFKGLKKEHPEAQFNMNMVKRYKEENGFVKGVERKVKIEFPVNGKPETHEVTETMRDACSTIVNPILNALHKLISSFDPEFQHKLRNNVILAGGGSKMLGLDRAIEEGLQELGGGKVTRVEEPLFAGANGALKLAQEMPMEYWERLS